MMFLKKINNALFFEKEKRQPRKLERKKIPVKMPLQ